MVKLKEVKEDPREVRISLKCQRFLLKYNMKRMPHLLEREEKEDPKAAKIKSKSHNNNSSSYLPL